MKGDCAVIMPLIQLLAILTALFVQSRHCKHIPQQATSAPGPVFRPCNKQVCASRISACQLIQSCNCLPPHCTCCADCTRCLGSLWNDCCDCLGLCQAHINSSSSLDAVIGDLTISIPSLFDALSQGPNNLPVLFVFRPEASISPPPGNITQKGLTTICKTAFFDGCRSLKQCMVFCTSMGAHRFKWFHNGCCQCVGRNCVDFGELKPRCKDCKN